MTTPPPPPAPSRAGRRFSLLALILVAAVSATVAGAVGHWVGGRGHGSGAATDSSKPLYQCPMHPTIVQDHPGDCPICGMKLVKVGAAGAGGSSSIEGLATVDIDPARQQLIGLKTASVTRGRVSGTFRTVGRVAVDERRVRHVNIKVLVYVERVYADFVGRQVKKGAALFSGYSPELLLAQEEYRIALATEKALATSSELDGGSGQLSAAARRKLSLLDVPTSAIKRIEQGGESLRTMTFSSPIAGVITKKDVVDGMKLEAGAMPYEIVDLSLVWVLADIYETDLGRVQIGMRAKLTLKAYPNRVFEGSAAFVDPVLDPKTRTVKLRLEFPNPNGELKPEMFGDVELESAVREGLRIPKDAVIDSGTKTVVFVALGDGKFQPRQVSLGDSDGVDVEVVSGLSEDEKVVVRANFLVDSESRLRASLAAMSTAPASAGPTSAGPTSAGPASAGPTSAGPASSGGAPSGLPAAPASGKPSPAPTPPLPQYACPMHPEVTDTKPSRCPKCGMFLKLGERKVENGSP